jgi:hypothetical protein
MAGLFFSRKSKNGVGAPAEPEDLADAEPLYEPLPAAPSLMDEPPDSIPGIPDLYGVLGVDPRSSDDIIRYAYRKKAAKLLDARWRPGRAARQLAELNAAYEILGKPDRRADYDRQRARHYYYEQTARQERLLNGTGPLPAGTGVLPTSHLAAPRPARQSSPWHRRVAPRGLLEAIAIVGVVVVAGYAGYTILGTSSFVDLTSIQDTGAALGLPIKPRTVPTASPVPSNAVLPTPTPRQVLVPPVSLPSPTPEPAPTQAPAAPVRSAVKVSDPAPLRRTEISITVHLARDTAPVVGVPVYLVAHYKTVDERFPANDGTVQTNVNGDATITFNIGDATVGFPVNVDVIGTVDGQQVQAQTTFMPR